MPFRVALPRHGGRFCYPVPLAASISLLPGSRSTHGTIRGSHSRHRQPRARTSPGCGSTCLRCFGRSTASTALRDSQIEFFLPDHPRQSDVRHPEPLPDGPPRSRAWPRSSHSSWSRRSPGPATCSSWAPAASCVTKKTWRATCDGHGFRCRQDRARRRPVPPFHAWRLNRPEAATIREADNDLHNGWVREADRQVIDLSAPYPWGEGDVAAVATDEMHAWAMTDPLLLAHICDRILVIPGNGRRACGGLDGPRGRDSPCLDAASCRRTAHRLAYLVQAAAVDDVLDMSRWRPLAKLAERHAARLDTGDEGLDGLLATIAARSLRSAAGRFARRR